MLSKRFESNEVDRRTWLHVPPRTRLPANNDTNQVAEISKVTFSKKHTPI